MQAVRVREGGCPSAASGAHLNLHLPTAKTNKRLIDVDSCLEEGDWEGEAGGINCCRADSDKLCDVTAAKMWVDAASGRAWLGGKTDAGHKQIKHSLVEKLIFCA